LSSASIETFRKAGGENNLAENEEIEKPANDVIISESERQHDAGEESLNQQSENGEEWRKLKQRNVAEEEKASYEKAATKGQHQRNSGISVMRNIQRQRK